MTHNNRSNLVENGYGYLLYHPSIYNDPRYYDVYDRNQLIANEYKSLHAHLFMCGIGSGLTANQRCEMVNEIVTLFKKNKLKDHSMQKHVSNDRMREIRSRFHMFKFFPYNFIDEANSLIDCSKYLMYSVEHVGCGIIKVGATKVVSGSIASHAAGTECA